MRSQLHQYAPPAALRNVRAALCAVLGIAAAPGPLAAAPVFTTLYTFTNAADSQNPSLEGLAPGPHGSLIGTVEYPGPHGYGLAAQLISPSFTFNRVNYGKHLPTQLWDIGRSGVIVGDFAEDPKNAPTQCFLLARNTRTRIDRPGASSTLCQGINKQGTVVGEYTVADGGLSTGFVYANGAFRNVSPPGAFETIVNAINDAGVMVGTCFDPNGSHGFTYDGSKYLLFDMPGALVTRGEGIDNEGRIVADALLEDDHQHAFLIRGQKFREIRFPSSRDNEGWHISSRGEVGFDWTDMTGIQHGGVYDSAQDAYYVVDVPGKVNTSVLAIGDAGTLVGTFQDRLGHANHGFVATGDIW
jgi:uncharacterized membrane protein